MRIREEGLIPDPTNTHICSHMCAVTYKEATCAPVPADFSCDLTLPPVRKRVPAAAAAHILHRGLA